MDKNNLLTHLREIHYPTAPSYWWPLPPWIYLLFFCLLLFTTLYFIYKRYSNNNKYKRNFLRELERIKNKNASPKNKIIFLSILLRKAVIYQFGRKKTAHLTNQHWLEFLNNTSNSQEFTHGVGKHLISAPYIKSIKSFNINALFALIKKWSLENL